MKLFRQLSGFWKNVLTLSSGTVLAQLLAIAATPVLVRLYEPESFAILGAYLGVVLVLTVIANGGYELAIMLPKEDQAAQRLFQLCCLLSLGLAVAFGLIALPIGASLLALLNLHELIGWHYLLPLSLLLEGCAQALYQWLNRKQSYRILSVSRLIKSLGQVSLSLLLGWLWGTFEGLLIGLLAGQLLGLASLLAGAQFSSLWKGFSFSKMRHTSRQYRDFPIFAMLSNGLNTAGKQLPFFFLPGLFPMQETGKVMSGHFQQTQKLLSLPIGFLGVALGSVFYERASRAKEAGGTALRKLSWQTAKSLFLMGLGPSILVMLIGPQLFGWVLGEEWIQAGYYARWLMPWFFLTFMSVPLSYLIDVQRKLGVYFLLNAMLFFGQLVALFIGAGWGQDELIQIYGGISALLVALQVVYFLYLGNKTDKELDIHKDGKSSA